ncbi:MAG: hypothetical protein ABFD82_08040 [Syntrophaceae bacterium]
MSYFLKSSRELLRYVLLLVFLIFVFAMFVRCGGGGGSDGGGGATPPPTPPASQMYTVLNSASIKPTAGGLVLVTNTNSETNGASVDIPPRAVSQVTTIKLGTAKPLPADSYAGQGPVGTTFAVEPAGLTFADDVTLTLPIPTGDTSGKFYIGRWDDTTKSWENLGGTIVGNYISVKIKHLSVFGVFNQGASDVRIVNQSGPQADLGIVLRYVGGPAIPPNLSGGTAWPAYPPLPDGSVTLKDGEARVLRLLPGRYHFLVSYPHPQPGTSNSLFFTIPQLTQGTDDGQIDQTITITLTGATSTDAYTLASISFPGNKVVPGTNLRPIIGCTALAPVGVSVLDRITRQTPILEPTNPSATRLVNVGPIKIQQLSPIGNLTLRAKVIDPEGGPLRLYWTWSTGGLPEPDTAASGTTKDKAFPPSNAPREGVYIVHLTVYDQYDLFDQCSWYIDARGNTWPVVKSVADDLVIDFGRMDYKRRVIGPYDPKQDLLYVSFPLASNPPPAVRMGTVTNLFRNLCQYIDPTQNHPETGFPNRCPSEAIAYWPAWLTPYGTLTDTYLETCPNDPADPQHVNPSQYVNWWPTNNFAHGATCIYAVIGDADGDPLAGGFRIPEPIHGRGTLYAAVPVPSSAQGGASIPLLEKTGTVADILPNGLIPGSIIDTYAKMDAYNATITYLANGGWLPVTATPLAAYAPLQPLPTWPSPGPGGPQALPIIWEAPDDPDSPSDTTHDCVTHVDGSFCSIKNGGTVQIEGWVRDGYSPMQRGFALVAYPDPSVIAEQCSTTQVAGGDTPDTRYIQLGKASGTVNFSYETYSIKDQIIVSYNGKVLFDTGCVGASDTVTFSYAGSSTFVTVQVIPNCAGGTTGTAWTYTVNCPK